ncbi:hypothetical protein NEOLI_002986 [Neolecta irregularis DAH-3]|uniref:Uncharacterized protein n=1 Tax=Neolecta irregularis (strain DAH-3) TaxID=1198029 RepID=A0A1U7LHA7_NEOID|nr:hypothetical protein NEOLI_002986 [Neolecta irregularis DAH-3]|eukprot:OLL22040.1 hypothetical protein NEOLI_002986 [Neolecta irregularis DAH-3]
MNREGTALTDALLPLLHALRQPSLASLPALATDLAVQVALPPHRAADLLTAHAELVLARIHADPLLHPCQHSPFATSLRAIAPLPRISAKGTSTLRPAPLPSAPALKRARQLSESPQLRKRLRGNRLYNDSPLKTNYAALKHAPNISILRASFFCCILG